MKKRLVGITRFKRPVEDIVSVRDGRDEMLAEGCPKCGGKLRPFLVDEWNEQIEAYKCERCRWVTYLALLFLPRPD